MYLPPYLCMASVTSVSKTPISKGSEKMRRSKTPLLGIVAQSSDTEFTEPDTVPCSVASVSELRVLCGKKFFTKSVIDAG
jgi:hypothetical protein